MTNLAVSDSHRTSATGDMMSLSWAELLTWQDLDINSRDSRPDLSQSWVTTRLNLTSPRYMQINTDLFPFVKTKRVVALNQWINSRSRQTGTDLHKESNNLMWSICRICSKALMIKIFFFSWVILFLRESGECQRSAVSVSLRRH